MKHTTALILALALGASCVTAVAKPRFEWVDSTSGLKVFSDRPPPGGPESVRNFVDHEPHLRALAPSAQGGASAAAPGAAPGATPGVDKALEAKKREAEEAEAAQQREAERQRAAQRADNCKRARDARNSLESGMRMARINEKGEREILTREMRAEESKRVQAIIEENCN